MSGGAQHNNGVQMYPSVPRTYLQANRLPLLGLPATPMQPPHKPALRGSLHNRPVNQPTGMAPQRLENSPLQVEGNQSHNSMMLHLPALPRFPPHIAVDRNRTSHGLTPCVVRLRLLAPAAA